MFPTVENRYKENNLFFGSYKLVNSVSPKQNAFEPKLSKLPGASSRTWSFPGS